MKIHRVRSSNFDDFINTPNLSTHIIVGLAEMHSNCNMFGGVNSDSFKMKYKNYCKFVKRALDMKVPI